MEHLIEKSNMNNEKALKWVQARISFIENNCSLEDDTNRNALDVLFYIEKILYKGE